MPSSQLVVDTGALIRQTRGMNTKQKRRAAAAGMILAVIASLGLAAGVAVAVQPVEIPDAPKPLTAEKLVETPKKTEAKPLVASPAPEAPVAEPTPVAPAPEPAPAPAPVVIEAPAPPAFVAPPVKCPAGTTPGAVGASTCQRASDWRASGHCLTASASRVACSAMAAASDNWAATA